MSLRTFGPAVVFLVLAAVAALLGFGAIGDESPLAAKVTAAFFVLAAVAALGWGWLNRAGTFGDVRHPGRAKNSA